MDPKQMSKNGRKIPTAISRMKQDYMRLKRDPLPYITAEPLASNMLEWHYVVKGPENSPYHGGYYHGTLLFPREFPFKPPSIIMFTPNGRFKTNTRLCLSISDFHPDTWNPTWCVGTILTGLLSFMLENTPTLGSIESSLYEKQQLAKKSLAFNLENHNFVELFPEICDEIRKTLDERKKAEEGGGPAAKESKTKSNDANPLDNDSTNSKKNGNIAVVRSRNTILNWQAIYSNLIVILSVAIFALVVNYVLKTLNQE